MGEIICSKCSGTGKVPEDNILALRKYGDNDKPIIKQILEYQEKAEKLDLILPWLRDNLTEKQLKLLSIISDPKSRKILAYLASDNTVHAKHSMENVKHE